MGVEAAIAAALVNAAVNIGMQQFGTKEKKEKRPKFQRQLIDQILSGLQGQGPLAGTFGADIGTFEKQYAEPLQRIFQNQIAPQIQQSYIAQGQHRGTPMESALARAGLNVQDIIGKQFGQYQQGGQNRTIQAIMQLLGLGAPGKQTTLTPFGAGLEGFTSGENISNIISELTSPSSQQSTAQTPVINQQPMQNFELPEFLETNRKGFRKELF